MGYNPGFKGRYSHISIGVKKYPWKLHIIIGYPDYGNCGSFKRGRIVATDKEVLEIFPPTYTQVDVSIIGPSHIGIGLCRNVLSKVLVL